MFIPKKKFKFKIIYHQILNNKKLYDPHLHNDKYNKVNHTIKNRLRTTNVKLIQGPYYAAVRRSIGAFRTSPTVNILTEAGMPSINNRTSYLTFKLIPKLFINRNKLLFQEVRKAINCIRTPRLQSTIIRCIKLSNNLDLDLNPIFIKYPTEPPWLLQKSSFILSMKNLPKTSTPSVVYQQTFKNISVLFSEHNWNFLFTDGSKSTDFTTFATVKQDGSLISSGFINNYCSNFTAEALAIFHAVEFASKADIKYIICTDSLSSILAIQNTSYDSHLINQIRNLCIQHYNKIKIMWVPSHVGILGNEYADLAAEEAKRRPLLKYQTWEARDIFNTISSFLKTSKIQCWSNYQHNYKNINPLGNKPIYPNNCSRRETTTIVRLRLGHCNFSHKYLLEKTTAPLCTTCNTKLSITHILDECTSYNHSRKKIFESKLPSDLLKNLSYINIKLICKFILENSIQT